MLAHLMPCGKAQAQLGQPLGRGLVRRFDNLQNPLVQLGPGGGRIADCIHTRWQGHIGPAPLHGPQIRRMHAIGIGQLEHTAVLGKQGHRRGRFTLEHALEVFGQRETGALHAACRILATQLRTLNKLLRQRFHGTQYFGGNTQAHHLQRSHCLVQLLARNTQLAGIELGQVGATGQFRITHKAAHGFGSAVERLAQLIQNPRQWAQITVHWFYTFGSNRDR